MSLIIQPPSEGVTLKYILELITNTKISFAVIGIYGGALFANNMGLGIYEILATSFLGLVASILASKEVQV